MASALVDASCLVSLFGARQPHAARYRELLQLAALEQWSLSTTWPCVVEAGHLVQPPERYAMLRWLGQGAVAIFPFDPTILLDLVPLMQRYTESPRTEMDLADASLYWLASETGVRRIMTLDQRDFGRYRLPDGQAFEIPVTTPATDLRAGNRRALAKAITLLESSLPAHRKQADALLTACLPHAGGALRLGLSGVPGVGKSSFIEALGLQLIAQGHRVAVLAVDPSSSLSGGSILGDKTRMERLAVEEAAFIRPSPSRGVLGGVASHTREVIRLVEAAGYDVVIVETVGVGQSEVAVAGMTDCFCLLQLPNAGDELQAIKRGVMELADLVVIHKADLDKAAATRAQVQIVSSLRLHGQAHGQGWMPEVLQASSLSGDGVAEVWAAVLRHQQHIDRDARRHQQDLAWLHERIHEGLRQAFHEELGPRLPGVEAQVAAGTLAASTAARELLHQFLKDR